VVTAPAAYWKFCTIHVQTFTLQFSFTDLGALYIRGRAELNWAKHSIFAGHEHRHKMIGLHIRYDIQQAAYNIETERNSLLSKQAHVSQYPLFAWWNMLVHWDLYYRFCKLDSSMLAARRTPLHFHRVNTAQNACHLHLEVCECNSGTEYCS
jgi:hypothetical protein